MNHVSCSILHSCLGRGYHCGLNRILLTFFLVETDIDIDNYHPFLNFLCGPPVVFKCCLKFVQTLNNTVEFLNGEKLVSCAAE